MPFWERVFLSGALVAPVHWSGTIYAILKEGINGNIHVKY